MRVKRGFTLIELLVVISILGLLATLALVALSEARATARDTRRLADIDQIQKALEVYYDENEAYPLPSSPLFFGFYYAVLGTEDLAQGKTCFDDSVQGFQTQAACVGTHIIGTLPKDPLDPPTWCGGGSIAPCYPFYLTVAADNRQTYSIYFYLEKGVGGISDGVHYVNQLGQMF